MTSPYTDFDPHPVSRRAAGIPALAKMVCMMFDSYFTPNITSSRFLEMSHYSPPNRSNTSISFRVVLGGGLMEWAVCVRGSNTRIL